MDITPNPMAETTAPDASQLSSSGDEGAALRRFERNPEMVAKLKERLVRRVQLCGGRSVTLSPMLLNSLLALIPLLANVVLPLARKRYSSFDRCKGWLRLDGDNDPLPGSCTVDAVAHSFRNYTAAFNLTLMDCAEQTIAGTQIFGWRAYDAISPSWLWPTLMAMNIYIFIQLLAGGAIISKAKSFVVELIGFNIFTSSMRRHVWVFVNIYISIIYAVILGSLQAHTWGQFTDGYTDYARILLRPGRDLVASSPFACIEPQFDDSNPTSPYWIDSPRWFWALVNAVVAFFAFIPVCFKFISSTSDPYVSVCLSPRPHCCRSCSCSCSCS